MVMIDRTSMPIRISSGEMSLSEVTRQYRPCGHQIISFEFRTLSMLLMFSLDRRLLSECGNTGEHTVFY